MDARLQELLEENPIIIAIKDEEGLARCLQNPKPVVFVLYGSVVSIPAIVQPPLIRLIYNS